MNNISKLTIIASAGLFIALSGNINAKDDTKGADLFKAKTCHTCHGDDAKTPTMDTYPIIAGQSEKYLVQQMTDFKNGKRTNSQAALMKAMLATVTEDEIKTLAAYVSSLPR